MKLEYRIFASILSASLFVILAFNILALYFFNQRTNDLVDSQNNVITHMTENLINNYYNDDMQIDEEEFASIQNQLINSNVPDGYMYIVDENRRIISHPDNQGMLVENLWYIEEMFETGRGNIQYRKGFEPNENDIRRINYFVHEGTGWLVAAGPSINRITVVSDNLYILFLAVTIVSILISFIVSMQLSKKIARPVNEGFQKIVEMTNDEAVSQEAERATGVRYKIMKKTISDIKKATSVSN